MGSDGEGGFGVQPRAPVPLWVSLISALTLKTSSGQVGNFPTEGPHPNSPNTQSRSVSLSQTIRLQVKKELWPKTQGEAKGTKPREESTVKLPQASNFRAHSSKFIFP